ncbi:MFS transporter [Cupriavidus oxalaticus]|uniref:MFS transporter n=1 Tax=Cupriavidus oxalaticus TaxID=96344 RepID=UPI0014382D74|nr:MFS transporter [Cupriavidus oxalaticus]
MSSSQNGLSIKNSSTKGDAFSACSRTKFSTSAALLTSLAVFSQEVVWNFYEAQVPPALRHYTNSAALIGLLMGIDNLLGLFIQPWMAHRSDNTNNRFGRRVPYLLIGVPIAATFYILIPWAESLPALIASMLCFALVANSFKSITEALVADFQSAENRGKANAMAKLAAALTISVGSGISYFVIDKSTKVAFAIPAFLLVIGMAIACWGLDERKLHSVTSEKGRAQQSQSFRNLIMDILRSSNRSRASMLLAVFATAGAWSAMRSQLSPYAIEILGLTRGQAGSLSMPAGIAFILAVFPLAILSDRSSRLSICKIGGLVFSVGCFVAFISTSVQATIIALVIASVGYAAFAINGVVIMWNLAPNSKCTGAYTGLYTMAFACGATIVPALIGLLVDATGWRYLMLYAGIAGLVAFLLFSRIRNECSINRP